MKPTLEPAVVIAAEALARECQDNAETKGIDRLMTMKVGKRNVLFAGWSKVGGLWWFAVPADDKETRHEVMRSFREIQEFAEC